MTPLEEHDFRERCATWLAEHRGRFSRDCHPPRDLGDLDTARAWQAAKADAGFACMAWPKDWGGRGLTVLHQLIFDEEESRFGLPPSPFRITLGLCMPTVLAHCADRTIACRFAASAMRGDEIWCQLFSEPGAGSDLAAVRTRATLCDNRVSWQIDGQKVWSTGAHLADYAILLARTDFEKAHKGLTMFWLDMRSQGVSVRPIRQMTGDSRFNEVFLDTVIVPDSQRLGTVGDGWRVAMDTLENERFALGIGHGLTWDVAQKLLDGTTDDGKWTPAPHREAGLDWYMASEAARIIRTRIARTVAGGKKPSLSATLSKLLLGEAAQRIAWSMLDASGSYGDIVTGQDDLAQAFLDAPAPRLAGGTDEILKNILADRVLNLPK